MGINLAGLSGRPDLIAEIKTKLGMAYDPSPPQRGASVGAGRLSASARLQALYPQEDSPAAMEGTAAHFYPSELLSGRVVGAGAVAPNGVVIDDE